MKVAESHRREQPSPDFAPVRMDDVEIGAALPALPATDTRSGISYGSSRCVVRLHGKALGLIDVELPSEGLSPDALAARIQAELADEVGQHLSQDGLPPSALDAGGLSGPEPPLCALARDELLRDAASVSVVICTRDRPDSVRTTVRSILACRYPSERLEVIVVDNASKTDAVGQLTQEDFEGGVPFRVVQEPEPGLSNARNKGLREATGQIVVFADDDVEVDRDWLAMLVGPFAARRAGGRHVGHDSAGRAGDACAALGGGIRRAGAGI